MLCSVRACVCVCVSKRSFIINRYRFWSQNSNSNTNTNSSYNKRANVLNAYKGWVRCKRLWHLLYASVFWPPLAAGGEGNEFRLVIDLMLQHIAPLLFYVYLSFDSFCCCFSYFKGGHI